MWKYELEYEYEEEKGGGAAGAAGRKAMQLQARSTAAVDNCLSARSDSQGEAGSKATTAVVVDSVMEAISSATN